MSMFVRLLISLVVGLVAATLYTLAQGGSVPHPLLALAFVLATTLTAALTSGRERRITGTNVSTKASTKTGTAKAKTAVSGSSGTRAEGTVKWFNVSKGFGFIVEDDEREIFVHFRSIRGEGRRSLREGQRVSYVATDSDKGPQAEDVEILN